MRDTKSVRTLVAGGLLRMDRTTRGRAPLSNPRTLFYRCSPKSPTKSSLVVEPVLGDPIKRMPPHRLVTRLRNDRREIRALSSAIRYGRKQLVSHPNYRLARREIHSQGQPVGRRRSPIEPAPKPPQLADSRPLPGAVMLLSDSSCAFRFGRFRLLYAISGEGL